MLDELPNDSDGQALRRLVLDGSDLSKPMEIDFAMDIPNRNAGLAFSPIVEKLGFRTRLSQDQLTSDWTCYCTCTIIPTHTAMIEIQKKLEEIGRPYGAKNDGWGSFGNAPE